MVPEEFVVCVEMIFAKTMFYLFSVYHLVFPHLRISVYWCDLGAQRKLLKFQKNFDGGSDWFMEEEESVKPRWQVKSSRFVIFPQYFPKVLTHVVCFNLFQMCVNHMLCFCIFLYMCLSRGYAWQVLYGFGEERLMKVVDAVKVDSWKYQSCTIINYIHARTMHMHMHYMQNG